MKSRVVEEKEKSVICVNGDAHGPQKSKRRNTEDIGY